MKLYQITYNTDGSIDSTIELPPDPPKKRILFVRETSEIKAKQVAKLLYSLAK